MGEYAGKRLSANCAVCRTTVSLPEPTKEGDRGETEEGNTAQIAESLAPAVSPGTGPRAEVMRATRPERIQLRLGLRGRILCAQQFVDVCGRFVGRKFKEPRHDRKN